MKQNHIVRSIFFAKTFGGETEKAKPLLNLLGLLTVNNIYRLQVLKLIQSVSVFPKQIIRYLLSEQQMN